MTSSSTVVIQNLAYLVGAIVLAIVIGVAVWLRHRPPRSVDANVESFHRGLRALAPDSDRPVTRPVGLRIQPPYAAPAPPADLDEGDLDAPDGEAPDAALAADREAHPADARAAADAAAADSDDAQPDDAAPEGSQDDPAEVVTAADRATPTSETAAAGARPAASVETPETVENSGPGEDPLDAADVVDLSKPAHHTAAGEAAGDWAGAETG